MPSKGKEKRAKRRELAGVTDNVLNELANEPEIGKVYSLRSQEYMSQMLNSMNNMYSGLSEDERQAIFPGNGLSPEEFLVADGPEPEFTFLAAWLVYYTENAAGLITHKVSRRTLLGNLDVISMLYRQRTGKSLSAELSGSLRRFIMTTLTEQCGLNVEPRERSSLSVDAIKLIARAMFNPKLYFYDYRSRFTMADWIAINFADSLRVGALVNSPGDTSKRTWAWGDLLILVARPSDPESPVNSVVIASETAAAKTANSAQRKLLFTMATYLGFDRVFLTLVLSYYAKTFPTGYSYRDLYDPKMFENNTRNVIEIKFAESARKMPVFGSWYRPQVRASKSNVNTALSRASVLCGFDRIVTSHMFRRSGATAQHVAGISSAEISNFLMHRWGSTTFALYTRGIVNYDVHNAVHGEGAGSLTQALDLEPTIVKVMDTQYALPLASRRQILESDDYLDLLEEHETYRREAFEKYNVDRLTELPKDVESEVRKRYLSVKLEFSRQRRYHRAVRVWHHRKWGEELVSAEEVEGESGEESDDDESSTQWLDEIPDPEEVNGDLMAVDRFLYEHDLESYEAGIAAAKEVSGAVDDLGAEGTLEDAPHPLDEDLDTEAGDSQSRDTNDDRASQSTEHVSPARTLPDDQCTAPSQNATTSMEKKGKQKAVSPCSAPVPPNEERTPVTVGDTEAIEDTDDNEKEDPYHTEMPGTSEDLELLAKMLYDTPSAEQDVFAAFDMMVASGSGDCMAGSFWPGHGPINDKCRFCQIPITDYVKQTRTTAMARLNKQEEDAKHSLFIVRSGTSEEKYTRDATQMFANHTRECAAKYVLAQHMDQLLAKYPSSITYDHFKAKAEKIRFVRNLRHTTRYDRKEEPYVKCMSCPDHPEVRNRIQACDHLIVHGVWCPPDPDTLPPPDLRKSWVPEVARFPLPVYYTHDNRHHWDPQELYQFCTRLIREKFHDDPSIAEGYGRDPNLQYADGILSEDDNNLPPDTKYIAQEGRNKVCYSQAFCLLCIHDPALSPPRAAAPYIDNVALRVHMRQCTRRHVKRMQMELEVLEEEGELPLRHDYLLNGAGHIECPDHGCKRVGRTCVGFLDFTWHLAAVHMYSFNGKRFNRNDIASLQEISFGSDGDLEDLLNEENSRTRGRRKAKAAAAAAKTGVAGPSGTSQGLEVQVDDANERSTVAQNEDTNETKQRRKPAAKAKTNVAGPSGSTSTSQGLEVQVDDANERSTVAQNGDTDKRRATTRGKKRPFKGSRSETESSAESSDGSQTKKPTRRVSSVKKPVRDDDDYVPI